MTDTAIDPSQQPPPDSPDAPDNSGQPAAVLASAAAPAPVDMQTPDAGQVAPTPTEGSSARVLIPEKSDNALGRIVDQFRDAIAGTQGRGVYIDPDTGERFVQHPTLTGKQQWMKVAGEAVRGAVSGYAAGRGAGNQGQAALAGMKSQMADKATADQAQDQQAQADFERDKAAKAAKANNQLLTTEVAKNEFALKRLGVTAGEDDIKFADGQEDREKQMGSADLGVYGDHYSLADVKKIRPEFWKDHYQDDNIVAIPNFNDKGERQGVHLYLRQPGIGDTPVDKGTQAYRFVQPTKPGEKPTLQTFTPSGVHTQRELDSYNSAAFAQMQTYQTTQAEAALKAAQTGEAKGRTAEAYASASKDHAEAAALNATASPAQMDSIARGLVDGTMDPSQLSKKAKDYDAKLSSANAYSIATTGKPFDIAKASADYKFATNPSTTNTLNFLNSLVGKDNASGNLAQIVAMSKKVGNTQFPAINDIAQWAKLEAGNPQVAAYHAGLTEVSDQLAKILQGGNGGGGTSDAKMRQAGELLNKGFNSDQITAVANDTLRPLLSNRKKEIIGDNRYLQRWHAPPTQAPPGASAEVRDKATGRLTGHVVNGAFVPVAATQ